MYSLHNQSRSRAKSESASPSHSMMLVLSVSLSAAIAGPTLWPNPLHSVSGTGSVRLLPSNHFFIPANTAASGPLLSAAFDRYTRLTFPHESSRASLNDTAGLASLQVSVAHGDESFPQLSTDESYLLEVSSTAARLSAKSAPPQPRSPLIAWCTI